MYLEIYVLAEINQKAKHINFDFIFLKACAWHFKQRLRLIYSSHYLFIWFFIKHLEKESKFIYLALSSIEA